MRTVLLLLPLVSACAGAATLSSSPSRAPALVEGLGDLDAEPATTVSPKRIRTGSVTVHVDDFSPFERDLEQWLSGVGGYVSDANLSHHEGKVSWATLTLRVPAESLDPLVGWAEETVQISDLSLHSADVTAEWVDIEARIANGRRTEARLQELLAAATGDLSDVLAVEAELMRVRGEVESAEGRMRVLADQVGFSTLTMRVQVRQVYVPLVSQSFSAEALDVLESSTGAMVTTGRVAALSAVAAAPWAAVLGGLPFFGLLALRRRRARGQTRED